MCLCVCAHGGINATSTLPSVTHVHTFTCDYLHALIQKDYHVFKTHKEGVKHRMY